MTWRRTLAVSALCFVTLATSPGARGQESAEKQAEEANAISTEQVTVNPLGKKDETPNNLIRSEQALVNDKPLADAAQAAAVFQQKFDEYKNALRDVEKLNIAFQTADEAEKKKLNEQLSGQVAHLQSLVNAMVEAAEAAYRAAPNKDPKISELLVAVVKYYTLGRQTGPAEGDGNDPFIPIDGGDQYERALPIIKLLIDGGNPNKQLYALGFVAAFMNNDYALAKQYLDVASENGVFQEIAEASRKDPKSDPEAGLMQNLVMQIESSAARLKEYPELWEKEQKIREAEAKADDLPRVKLITSKGEIVVELFENEAPQTVANFLTLVKEGFYNDSPFHRVLSGFMAQGGAKTADGQGGPGYTIACECYRPDYRRHFRGTLSMAHAGRDTGNSQFFITFVPTSHLNGKHTAFGRVIEGMEVLGDLQRRSPIHQPNPPQSDKIIKAEVIRDRGHEYKFEKGPDR